MWVQATIIIRRRQDWTNPFASATGEKSAMRPFFQITSTLVQSKKLSFMYLLIDHIRAKWNLMLNIDGISQ